MKLKKGLLNAVKKFAEADVKNGNPLFCPVFFHQPKRPKRGQIEQIKEAINK